jgi:hypothetical protein
MFGNTFTAINLKIILCEAMDKLGYHWYESGISRTREGLYQTSIEVRYTLFHAAEPIFTIYDKALSRICEAKESVLIRALFLLTKAWGTRLAMFTMLSTPCLRIRSVR